MTPATATATIPPVFAIADLTQGTKGGELAIVPGPMQPVTQALDRMLGTAEVAQTVRTFGDRLTYSFLGGVLGSCMSALLTGATGGTGLLAGAMATTAALGSAAWFFTGRATDKRRVRNAAPAERLAAIEGTPVQKALVAEAGARLLRSTTETVNDKAWRAKLSADVPDLAPATAAALEAVFDALFAHRGLGVAYGVDERRERLLHAIEALPRDELPAVRHLVEAALRRIGGAEPAPNTTDWFVSMPVVYALEGRRFKFADHVGEGEAPKEGTILADELDLAIARVDYGIKRSRASADGCAFAGAVMTNHEQAVRVAAHFEKQGLRASVRCGHHTKVTVAIYEDGKQPPNRLHDKLPWDEN